MKLPTLFKVIIAIRLLLAEQINYAQTEIEKRFRDFSINNLQEKIYVHLNRPDHIVGEVLWFKVYCADGMLHQPLDLSQVVYVEIFNSDNEPVLQTKISVLKGEGTGSFYLPATLPTGNYLFRAYTNWMKNSPAHYFFSLPISIVNTLKASHNKKLSLSPGKAIDVQFFPEGGYIIDNIESRVGFRAVDDDGNGVDCIGSIVNQSNDTIVKFKTARFGLGSFNVKMQHDSQYRAIIASTGNVQTIPFPEVKESGYSLRVMELDGDSLNIQVEHTEKLFLAHLFIHARQSIKASEIKSTSDGVINFFVDKSKLGDGVSHITILNEKGQPACERLYFKNPEHVLNIKTNLDQNEYSVRRKVRLSINESENQSANLSVSVFRTDSITRDENICTYFYLTSDLTGTPESPAYYFEDTAEARLAADNLMLTHGWRRFKWNEILSGQKPVVRYLPELNGQLIQAGIFDENQKPVNRKIGYLAIPGKRIRLYLARSDSAGRLYFKVKPFEGTKKLVLHPNLNLDSTYSIQLENPFDSNVNIWNTQDLRINKLKGAEILDRSISMQVQDAFFEDEVYFQFKNAEYDTIPFYGKADETYWLDDYTRFPVLEEVLREYVKGVWVRKRGDRYRLMVLDKGKVEKTEVFRENPLILFDGMPVFDVNRLLAVDPLKIKKLEVLTRKYFLGPLAFNGIVSFSTYNGDLNGFEMDPRSITLDYEGLQSQREFYSARYTNPELRGSRLPDQRHQLYWNPNVKLVKGQVNPIDFYTSDVEGNFFVVMEGLSESGMPGFSVTSFKVSK